MLQSLSAMPLEMCMIAIVLAFIANFFFGKQKNRSIAKKWFSSIESVLESQFAVVGAYDPPQKSKLYKVSHSEYRVYASGRRNCSGLLAIIEVLY
jgi:tRNA(Arg) A34 adenosine deaminase TadA